MALTRSISRSIELTVVAFFSVFFSTHVYSDKLVDKNLPDCSNSGSGIFCDIQPAINLAISGETIYVAPGSYGQIRFTNSSPVRTLTLQGVGPDKTIIRGGFQRAVTITENVTLKDIAIRDSQPPKSGPGGGVYIANNNSSLGPALNITLSNVIVANNAGGEGAGITLRSSGGALDALIENSAIIENVSQVTRNDDISSTYKSIGGGILVGDENIVLTIANSVIANNTAVEGNTGGGFGGGLANLGTTYVINSTFSGNTSLASIDGGGAFLNGYLYQDNFTNDKNLAGTLYLHNVTIVENTVLTQFGGIHNVNGNVTLENTILAGNSILNSNNSNCGGQPFSSQGYNIVGALTGCSNAISANTGDRLGENFASLNLSALPVTTTAGYELPMAMTHILNSGSIAIDSGNSGGCSDHNAAVLTSDQRGASRGSTCDIGAHEIASAILTSPSDLLTTIENQGSASVQVSLGSPPILPVAINITSSDINGTEGLLTTTSLTFDNTNWSTPKTTSIDVINDQQIDGNQTYSLTFSSAASADTIYSSLPAKTITVTNVDVAANANPLPPGFEVDPTGIVIQEGVRSDTISIRLKSPPAPGTHVDLGITSEQSNQDSIGSATLVFTDTNWSEFQNITVDAVDDNFVEQPLLYNIIVSLAASTTDQNYLNAGLQDQPVSVTNNDNDTPGGISLSRTSGLITSESGGQDTFTVTLTSQPQPDTVVEITFTSQDPNEGVVTTAMPLTFTPDNYNQSQTVIITGQDDALTDCNKGYLILAQLTQSADPNFSGIQLAPISASNLDNEPPPPIGNPNITVNKTSLQTTESAGPSNSDSFTISLASAPAACATVTIPLTIEDSSEGQFENETDTTQVLLSQNNMSETITVQGKDDSAIDGDISYTITTGNAVSSIPGSGYDNMVVPDISVINLDNDTVSGPGVLISKSTLITSENSGPSGEDSFNISLNTTPANNATVSINLEILGNGKSEIAFDDNSTTKNIQLNQSGDVRTITVRGRDDSVLEGDEEFKIRITTQSSDANYNNLNFDDISVINNDNESSSAGSDSGGGSTNAFLLILLCIYFCILLRQRKLVVAQ